VVCGIDLQKRGVRDFEEGWDTLDLDNGYAWDLICQLLEYEPTQRISANAALSHPLFGTGTLAAVATTLARVASAPLQVRRIITIAPGCKLGIVDLLVSDISIRYSVNVRDLVFHVMTIGYSL
jgi:serine/threonine protein kinase